MDKKIKKQTGARLDSELYQQAKIAAAIKHITLEAFIEEALTYWIRETMKDGFKAADGKG